MYDDTGLCVFWDSKDEMGEKKKEEKKEIIMTEQNITLQMRVAFGGSYIYMHIS